MSTAFEQTTRRICIEFMDKAKECLIQGDLAGAKSYLNKAKAKADDQLRGEIQTLEREQIQALETQIQADLEADPYDEGRVQSLIDQLEGWVPGHERAVVWRKEARERGERWGAEQRIKQVRQEVEGFLAEATELGSRGADVPFVEKKYKQALQAAQAARSNFPEVLDFIDLTTKATSEYNKYMDDARLYTTLGTTGYFRQALMGLDQLKPAERVQVFNLRGQPIGFMSVEDARRTYIRQANEWVMGKAPGKIEEALESLNTLHSPDSAYRVLFDFQVNVEGLIPDPEKEAIAKVLREDIEPARQRRREANRLLLEAETSSLTEIAQAWDKMQQARKEDPHAPDLERVQTVLRERLRGHVERLLAEGEKLLGERHLEEAGQRAGKALEEASLDHTPEMVTLQGRASSLEARIQAAKSQARDVADTLAGIRQLLERKTRPEEAGGEARQKWEALKDRLGKAAADYPEIGQVGARIGKFLDVAQFLASVETLLQGRDEAALATALGELEKVGLKYPDKKDTLSEYERRIKARQAFLEAEREIDTGSLLKAERLLQTATGGDDRDQAQGWLRQIREGKGRDADAQRDLQQAPPLLAGKPEEAYKILLRWRQDRWLPSRDQITEAWHQLAAAWLPGVEKELESLLQAQPGMLDVHRARFLVEEVLVNLGAPRVPTWRERVLPRCSSDLATSSEELGKWPEAVYWWQEAIKEAPAGDLAGYRGRLENARLQEALQQLDPTDVSDAARDKLRNLEKQYPRSVEVKRRLAELHQARDEMDEALRQAQRGLVLIDQLGQGQEHRPAFEAVQKRVERLEAAAAQQREVEQLLTPEASVEEYAQAPAQVQKIIEEFPELRADLDIWWEGEKGLKKQVIKRLELELKGLDPRPGAIFEQIEIASRILCLNETHREARNKLDQLDASLVGLEDEVKKLQAHAEGHGLGQDAVQALKEHLRQATTLRNQARTARQVLARFGPHLGDRRPENLGELIKTLEGMVKGLEEFQAEWTKARAGLAMAKAGGVWSTVEAALEKIKGLGYDQHRSTEYLKQEVRTIRERRARLETLARQIEEDWKHDRFQAVLDGLAQMEDKGLGDPEGEFGFGPLLSLKDPEGRRLAQGIRACRELAQARLEQVNQMETWLQRLRDWADWPKVRQEAEALVARGQFGQALQHGQTTLGNPGAAGVWFEGAGHDPSLPVEGATLEQALAYLRHPPISSERLLSRSAVAVQTEAENRQHTLEQWIQEAQHLIATVYQKEREWNAAWEELNRAKKNLNRLNRGGPVRQIFRQREMDQARERLSVAVGTCARVCPDHPLLKHFQPG